MDLVIRMSKRRIERIVYILLIAFFIFTTLQYANKYYDMTPEDTGYLDKIFSGTFFSDVPTEAPKEVKNESVNVTEEVIEEPVVKEEVVEPEVTVEPEVNVTPAEIAVPTECGMNDFKVTSWVTEQVDDDTSKKGLIEKVGLQYCDEDADDQYMLAEVFIWDEFDIDEDIDITRKTNAWFTTPQTMLLSSKEKFSKTYTFPKNRSVYRDSKFHYIVKFWYVDQEGEKIEKNEIKELTGSYTIK